MFVRIGVFALCLAGSAFGQDAPPGSRNAGPGYVSQRSAQRALAYFSSPVVRSWAEAVQPSLTPEQREFRLLATNKTSTMQKEMNEAASAGFHFEGTMGGETSFGGSEVVVILS